MSSPADAVTVARRPFWVLLLAAAFVVALFVPTFQFLASRVWLVDDNYSHGFFILPIALWLAWRVIEAHPLPQNGSVSQGTLTLAAGLVLHLVWIVLPNNLLIEVVAMVFVLRGLAVLLGGPEWANWLLFPTLFLAFLFPLPVALTRSIAVALQNVIATISTEVLGWFFFCYRRGPNIFVAGVAEPMVIAEECSGVRQIMAFVALGALVAYMGKTGWARGLLLVALSVPVAIMANVARVILMGAGRVYFGPTWLTNWMHDLPALFTLPFGILCFFGLVWLVSPTAAEKEPA